jgi:hypothetical protein
VANAWAGHFYKEAQSHKVIYDQVSHAYEQHEAEWKLLNLETAHWTEIAEVIRWANAMAKESFSNGYNYFVYMIEHQKEGSIFGAKKRMESFASANKHIADWTKVAVAKWDKLATEYGVTLVDHEKDEIEIALMADASLVDIYRYTNSKWSKAEADLLVKKVREKFEISDQEFANWKKQEESVKENSHGIV